MSRCKIQDTRYKMQCGVDVESWFGECRNGHEIQHSIRYRHRPFVSLLISFSMSSSGVVSKKLKFKGDKTKKKRKVHREEEGDDGEFAAMAAADPKGGFVFHLAWVRSACPHSRFGDVQ